MNIRHSIYGAVISEQAFSNFSIYYMHILNIKTTRVLSSQNCIKSIAVTLPYLLLCLLQFLSAPKKLSRVCLSLISTPQTPIKKPYNRGLFCKCYGSFHGAQYFFEIVCMIGLVVCHARLLNCLGTGAHNITFSHISQTFLLYARNSCRSSCYKHLRPFSRSASQVQLTFFYGLSWAMVVDFINFLCPVN